MNWRKAKLRKETVHWINVTEGKAIGYRLCRKLCTTGDGYAEGWAIPTPSFWVVEIPLKALN